MQTYPLKEKQPRRNRLPLTRVKITPKERQQTALSFPQKDFVLAEYTEGRFSTSGITEGWEYHCYVRKKRIFSCDSIFIQVLILKRDQNGKRLWYPGERNIDRSIRRIILTYHREKCPRRHSRFVLADYARGAAPWHEAERKAGAKRTKA